MTTNEALCAANMDWTVSKIPLLSSHDLSTVDSHYLTLRDDTKAQLGVVGSRYQPVSNRDAFELFDMALGAGQGQIDTAKDRDCWRKRLYECPKRFGFKF